jgi:hypothetical protein
VAAAGLVVFLVLSGQRLQAVKVDCLAAVAVAVASLRQAVLAVVVR